MKNRSKLISSSLLIVILLYFSQPWDIAKSVAELNPSSDFFIYLPLIIRSDSLATINPDGQTIIFWRPYPGPGHGDLLDAMIQDFNQTNEWNITVHYEFSGNYVDLHEHILDGISRNALPALAMTLPEYAAAYVNYDVLMPLTPYVKSPTWGFTSTEWTDFYSATLESGYMPQFKERYGWPSHYYLPILYYNQDWLTELGYAEPPETWLTFEEIISLATNTPFSGKIGNQSAIGYEYETSATWFSTFLASQGGAMLKQDASAYIFNQQVGLDMMMQWQTWVSQTWAVPTIYKYQEQEDFGNGSNLFSVASSSSLPYYEYSIQQGANFAWGITSIPQASASMVLPIQPLWSRNYIIFQSTPEEQLAAWLFVKWMSATPQQVEWIKTTGHLSIRKSTEDYLTDYIIEHPYYAQLLDFMTYQPHIDGQVGGYTECRDAIKVAMTNIFSGATVEIELNEAITLCNASLVTVP